MYQDILSGMFWGIGVPKLKEKDIENQILAWLWSKRIFAWKNQSVGVFDRKRNVYRKSTNPFHIKGASDILGVYNGRFLAIEVKSDSGKLSDNQKEFLERINSYGGIAFVARSVEDVESKLFNNSIEK